MPYSVITGLVLIFFGAAVLKLRLKRFRRLAIAAVPVGMLTAALGDAVAAAVFIATWIAVAWMCNR
ncbi:MAG: hypothetical protein ACP5R4_00400 [Armatimonadota bacterium]